MIVVDVHAEATSEKVALARWLDGRVTAVLGTHTHVQTSDARILPGGTAAITDVGMTGPHDSVIGVADQAIYRMRTGMPVRFETAEGGVQIEGALVECDASGRATAIEPLRVPFPEQYGRAARREAGRARARGATAGARGRVHSPSSDTGTRAKSRRARRRGRSDALTTPPGDERHRPARARRETLCGEHLPERHDRDECGRAQRTSLRLARPPEPRSR